MRLAFFGLLLACSGKARPPVDAQNMAASPQSEAPVGGTCDPEPGVDCGAGDLPRLSERQWSVEAIEAFATRAARGTTAVAVAGERVTLQPTCRLGGAYSELRGEPGSGRMWATNRGLLSVEEVDASCAGATHVVAAYVRRETRFEAILVPLPCPSTSELGPAAWCVGSGLTGAERRARADETASPADAYALAPDHIEGLERLHFLALECPFAAQVRWVEDGFSMDRSDQRRTVVKRLARRHAAPAFDVDHPALPDVPCRVRPAFTTCFGELFDPVPTGLACFVPVLP